ncbi:ATP-binding protein [Flavobacterium sp. RSP49]|uniref:ATP-binding protein n=1 Tax=Flavobacterium sp. RSP49 TaxID=2497487 RepID=UPI000F84C0D1|nr:ATP-binding protein [Flavobacterium sp. RSP49]RTZ01318.1 ATP-binding protein [Flavobacterium sp. RSP49]
MSSNPFNHSHFIGYINQVTPQYVKVHFPSSVLMKSFTFYGEELKGGLVGNYVVIEGEKYGFLGKILELSLPEKERLELSEKSFNTKEFHPTGKIEILLSFELFEPSNIDKGLNSLPMIGAKVFICSSQFIKGYFKGFGVKKENLGTAPVIKLGHLTYDKTTIVELSQQAIFGRHCAIVGTTGGGKSYTVSKLVEGIIDNNNKAIVIDPTGEYKSFDKNLKTKEAIISLSSYFPYQKLTISDVFVLFRPSGQVQQPILLEAIKSLKISHCLMRDQALFNPIINGTTITLTISGKNIILEDGVIVKEYNETSPFKNAHFKYKTEIEDDNTSYFDINKLSRQIINECVYDNGANWGKKDERNFGNCTSLIIRVNNLLADESFKKMFGFNIDEESNLIDEIEDFLKNDELNVLRIGFEDVPYNFQAREILANAIGKYLLNKSRTQSFKEKPLVLFIDEAHQFLNKKVKDEYFESTELNSFDSIAKESRKYGLFLCIATQMPRDIPNGTLSQIGTFIAHRLINHQDKEAIANACSSANRDTLAFLPVLGSGEAILMGVDFPMPVMLKVEMPTIRPNSDTPLF